MRSEELRRALKQSRQKSTDPVAIIELLETLLLHAIDVQEEKERRQAEDTRRPPAPGSKHEWGDF